MKFLVPNYSCLQNPWLGATALQVPVLSVLCPQPNLLNTPPPRKNSWLCHWPVLTVYQTTRHHILEERTFHNRLICNLHFKFLSVRWIYAEIQTQTIHGYVVHMVCGSTLLRVTEHRHFRFEACRRQNAMNAKSDVLSAIQNCLCGKRRLVVEMIFNYWRNSLFSSEDTDSMFSRNVCAFLTETGRHTAEDTIAQI